MTKSQIKPISKPIATLRNKKSLAMLGGGEDKLEKQRTNGKLTARERIGRLVDFGTFMELGMFVTSKDPDSTLGDGVITGIAEINGRPIVIFSQDFSVQGGSLSLANSQKIVKAMEHAERVGCPIVGLNDSGGARIQEGVESLAGYADIFLKNVELSGVVPQISAILGPCAGGAVYSPALTDFVIMVDKISHMFVTGPEVIKTVTKEDVSMEDLGGAHTHEAVSGVSNLTAYSEEECFDQIRKILSYLPQSFNSKSPRLLSGDIKHREDPSLNSLIPEESNQPYDIKAIINSISDKDSFFELQVDYAKNIVIGFARINGYAVGIVANQPMHLAGCLDIQASTKAARFVRTCDAFNVPLITLVDVPGFLPGTKQEWGGIIRHGAKLLYAFAEANVPKITVICRKAYGGAYDVMSSKHLKGDLNIAFPSAEVAVMGPEGAVKVIKRKEIAEGASEAELVAKYKADFSNPWQVAALGYVDMVIEPSSLRTYLSEGLEFLQTKNVKRIEKKHGNIPL